MAETDTRLVSVLVATYNYGRFIEESLHSAIAQTYRPLEIIVVDDGSTDDTRQRVARFGDRVRYLRQDHSGVSAARNLGIQQSRGEYLAFLDADDVWSPHKVERSVAALRENPTAGVAYHWRAFADEAGRALPQVFAPTHQGDVLEELLRGSFIVSSSATARRVCVMRAGGFDVTLPRATDYDLFVRMALAGDRFVCVPEVLVRRRLHHDSLAGDPILLYRAFRTVLDRTFASAALPAGLRSDRLRAAAYRGIAVAAAADCIRQGRDEEGCAVLREGLLLQPDILDRPAFYIGMALAMLPFGERTWEVARTSLESLTPMLTGMLGRLFDAPDLPPQIRSHERSARSACGAALALLYARAGKKGWAIRSLTGALALSPVVVAAALARGLLGSWAAARNILNS
jgi:glycosyltransferase involved in cell wall biosynthesis